MPRLNILQLVSLSLAVLVTCSSPNAKASPRPPNHKWWNLGGRFSGHPAVVSWAPTRTDVFVRGTNNNVYHKWQINGRGTTWYPSASGSEHLGGTIYGDLAAVSWSAHRIDLFGLGLDNACWHQWWNGKKWGGWQSLGGRIIGDISAVSWATNRIDLFARGMDNTIYHNSWKGKEWSGWYSIGGTAVGSPKVVSWGQQRLDVFIRGPDNAVYHKGWHGSHWRPSPFGWYNLGGVALDDIQAVSSRPRRLDIFTRNAENEVSHRAWEGSSWGDWESLGGVTLSRPDAVAWNSKHITLAIQGVDNAVHVKEFDGEEWTRHWRSIRGVVTDAPVIHPRGGNNSVIFARGMHSGLVAYE